MPIFYTGIGSGENNEFSEIEFHQMMIREFIQKPQMNYFLRNIRNLFPNSNFPQEYALFTLDDWIEFVGASRI